MKRRVVTLLTLIPSVLLFGFVFAQSETPMPPESLAAKIMLFVAAVSPMLTVYITQGIRLLLPKLEGEAVRVSNLIVNGVSAVIASLLMGNQPYSLEGIITAILMWLLGHGVDIAYVDFYRKNVRKILLEASSNEQPQSGSL